MEGSASASIQPDSAKPIGRFDSIESVWFGIHAQASLYIYRSVRLTIHPSTLSLRGIHEDGSSIIHSKKGKEAAAADTSSSSSTHATTAPPPAAAAGGGRAGGDGRGDGRSAIDAFTTQTLPPTQAAAHATGGRQREQQQERQCQWQWRRPLLALPTITTDGDSGCCVVFLLLFLLVVVAI
jgi:hypothetical protein